MELGSLFEDGFEENSTEQWDSVSGGLSAFDLRCSRAFTAESELWTWRDLVIQGETSNARRNGCLVRTAADGRIVAQWVFEGAWCTGSGDASAFHDRIAGIIQRHPTFDKTRREGVTFPEENP